MKFEESQAFRQKGWYFIYFILSALLALLLFADIKQIILHTPFGDKPASNIVLLLLTIFLIAFLLLLFATKLQTLITDEGVFYRWKPFKKRFIRLLWSEIEKAELITYGAVGLRLILKSGKKLIVGTQRSKELTEFLQKIDKLSK